MEAGTCSSLESSYTSLFSKSAIGLTSTPPSPYFVKKPTPKSSTLLPVPATRYLCNPAKKYKVVIRNLALVLARLKSRKLSSVVAGISVLNSSKTGVRSTFTSVTFANLFLSCSICSCPRVTCLGSWCMGISTHNTRSPVLAQRVEVRALSIPPLIPKTNPSIFAFVA